MDAFGDNFVNPEVDPAAEFLAREQDELAGLEDEITPMAVTLAAQAAAGHTEGKQIVLLVTCGGKQYSENSVARYNMFEYHKQASNVYV